jgi:hypothetical protein
VSPVWGASISDVRFRSPAWFRGIEGHERVRFDAPTPTPQPQRGPPSGLPLTLLEARGGRQQQASA